MIKLTIDDFNIETVAFIDSDADQNCIKEGLVPTKFCDKTREQLMSANGAPLKIKYKLDKVYICNDGYCFKNTFFIVKDITNDLILGTPFLTQIYPFYVNEIGVHTNIMGKMISFKFLSPTKQKESSLLQSSSIYHRIDSIQKMNSQISFIKDNISYLSINEQLQDPT